ncbi:hypothetical protein [Iodobacter sp.]|uniref:hypothetical protein n=1 Tax=Iodobacter sp. TaxID=1915058 RepID=UPI0025DE02FA|nr:hypothetical protein [Iodobacter sp.]
MPIRKDFAERLSMFAPEAIDTSDWCEGFYLTISVRGIPSSAEHGAHGVAVFMRKPIADTLYRFADTSALAPQFSEATIAQWQSLILRCKWAFDHGILESPAPNTLIYSRQVLWRHPSPDIALQRAWTKHVNFLLPPSVKTQELGGIIQRPDSPAMSAVLADLRAVFGALLNENHDNNITTLEYRGRVTAVVAANDPLLAADAVTEAGISLAMQSDHPAQLLVLLDHANELSAELAHAMAMLRERCGIDASVSTPQNAVEKVSKWLYG